MNFDAPELRHTSGEYRAFRLSQNSMAMAHRERMKVDLIRLSSPLGQSENIGFLYPMSTTAANIAESRRLSTSVIAAPYTLRVTLQHSPYSWRCEPTSYSSKKHMLLPLRLLSLVCVTYIACFSILQICSSKMFRVKSTQI